FRRDHLGRISEIIDPRGSVLSYRYDPQGRLVAFYDRLANERLQSNRTASPTRFEYNPTTSPPPVGLNDWTSADREQYQNYLINIIDPLGVDALRTNYG